MKDFREKRIIKQEAVKPNRRHSSIQKKRISITDIFIKGVKGVLTLILISGSGYLGFHGYRYLRLSEYFRIRQFEMKTDQGRVDADEVMRFAGITSDLYLNEVDLRRLAERLARHPWIKNVHIKRAYPHSLILEIEEMRPEAIVLLEGMHYMDKGGRIFKSVGKDEPMDYPIISGIPMKETREEEGIRRLHSAVQLLSLAKKGERLKDFMISELHWRDGEGWTVYPHWGWLRIRFGDGDFSRKWDHLERVLERLEESLVTINSIDLRVKSRVIVQLVSNTQEGETL